ncbi:MAG TPA: amidase domain-containing protein [Clostridia bacterium]|nr:amidase domain-containing protein [Clostridia bacterium]
MFNGNTTVSDSDRKIHDEVFIESIDRRERIKRFLTAKLGIDDASARDEGLAADILEQLLREDNPLADEILEDAAVFLSELEDDDYYMPVFMNGHERANSYYDRSKAKAYIDTYWKNYNPAYPSFHHGGGDCTNFVSQVLFAGGMPWADDKNPANHKKSVNWYCKPGATNKDSEKRITFSWKIAAVFKAHWIKRVEAHRMYSYAEAIQNMNEVSDGVFLGDVVQFCYSSGVPYHTLAVTGFNRDPEYNVRDIVLASHDIDSNTRSLYRTMLQYPSDYKLRVYNIKLGG